MSFGPFRGPPVLRYSTPKWVRPISANTLTATHARAGLDGEWGHDSPTLSHAVDLQCRLCSEVQNSHQTPEKPGASHVPSRSGLHWCIARASGTGLGWDILHHDCLRHLRGERMGIRLVLYSPARGFHGHHPANFVRCILVRRALRTSAQGFAMRTVVVVGNFT